MVVINQIGKFTKKITYKRGHWITIELMELTLTNFEHGNIVTYEDVLLLAEFHKALNHFKQW